MQHLWISTWSHPARQQCIPCDSQISLDKPQGSDSRFHLLGLPGQKPHPTQDSSVSYQNRKLDWDACAQLS